MKFCGHEGGWHCGACCSVTILVSGAGSGGFARMVFDRWQQSRRKTYIRSRRRQNSLTTRPRSASWKENGDEVVNKQVCFLLYRERTGEPMRSILQITTTSCSVYFSIVAGTQFSVHRMQDPKLFRRSPKKCSTPFVRNAKMQAGIAFDAMLMLPKYVPKLRSTPAQ